MLIDRKSWKIPWKENRLPGRFGVKLTASLICCVPKGVLVRTVGIMSVADDRLLETDSIDGEGSGSG